MSLWLCNFFDVEDGRYMCAADLIDASFHHLAEFCVIPALHIVNIDPIGSRTFAEAFQCF